MRSRRIAAAAAVMAALASPNAVFAQDEPAADPAPPEPRVVPPNLVSPVQPEYPAQALEDRAHGIVVLTLSIDDTGVVSSAVVESLTVIPEDGEPRASDGRYGFGPAAIAAAEQLVFEPAQVDGKPFSVQVSFTYRFALPPKPDEPEDTAEPPQPEAPPQVNYRGVLLERGTRKLVTGATVTVYRGKGEDLEGYEATTDAKGSYRFYDLPPGTWTVRIDRDGYIPIETKEELSTTEVVEGRYWIERGTYSEYDITIEAERPKKEVNRRSLSVSEISKTPGTIADDPVLVIENLPGVARSGPVGGEIIVRGSGPTDTGVFVNGIAVPLIYHFGGLKSVLPSRVVGGIDFYPGNYSVAYGRAMGGILDLRLKRLEPDQVHGSIDVSVLDTSLYLEVPISDDAAFAVAGRRSYVDFVLDATLPEDAGLALINAPRYYDYQILGNWRPEPEHEFRWLAMGSDDLFELLFDDASDEFGPGVAESNDFSAHTSFQRLISEYSYVPSERFNNRVRFSLGRDALFFTALGTFEFDATLDLIQLRENATYVFNDRFTLETGFDSAIGRFAADISLPPLPSEGEPDDDIVDPDEILTTSIKGDVNVDIAPFIEGQIRMGDLLVVPGLRLDYFGVTGAWSVDPRISGRYQLPADVALKAGAAVVHQAPDYPEADPTFGNPDLDLQMAIQYSVGAEWLPIESLRTDVTLFYKDMNNLVGPTDAVTVRDGRMVPAVFDNNAEGRVYGVETFIEKELTQQLRGWISYTLSRAQRRDSANDGFRLFDFDQTHIFALVASYLLPENWEVGARYRFVTGSPTTPAIDGVYRNDLDSYVPIYGPVNSGRLPTFHQFDLRIDKTWIQDTWRFSAYLSLINATNHKNVEGLTYNYDYTERGSINGLPILPIFGVKGEW